MEILNESSEQILNRFYVKYGWVKRAGQIQMASTVEKQLEKGLHCIGEGGTGVGKSIGYLVPALLYALRHKKKIVVSTASKHLQKQLENDVLPKVTEIFKEGGVEFKYQVFMGSTNYLCKRQVDRVKSEPAMLNIDGNENKLKEELQKIEDWMQTQERFSGLRRDIAFAVSNELWGKICRPTDYCMGQKCDILKERKADGEIVTRLSNCPYQMTKLALKTVDLIVLNHSLFFAHIACGDRLLPKFDAVVFDEAHEMEDFAVSFFASSVSNYSVSRIVNDILKLGKMNEYLDIAGFPAMFKGVEVLCGQLGRVAQDFFKDVETKFEFQYMIYEPDGKGGQKLRHGTHVQRIKKPHIMVNTLNVPLQELSQELLDMLPPKDASMENLSGATQRQGDPGKVLKNLTDGQKKEIEVFATRLRQMGADVTRILGREEKGHCYWAEMRIWEKGRMMALKSSPLDISATLRENIFEREPATQVKKDGSEVVVERFFPCSLFSATMRIDGKFDFIRKRLGLRNAVEGFFPSPFNYREQAMLYIPTLDRLISPRDKTAVNKREYYRTYIQCMASHCRELIGASKGGAFVLCTSNKDKMELYRELKSMPYNVLVQEEDNSERITEEFKADGNAVLIGVKTFRQGVDIPGRALRNLIITKLPFANLGEPRQEELQELVGRNSFFEDFYVPEAILDLLQAVGRLIRTETDFGVVSILDTGMWEKNAYQKKIRRTLPPMPETSSLEMIKAFYQIKMEELR